MDFELLSKSLTCKCPNPQLQDVLGFVPKVDFNAGVVAAGEAQIESTVTGNNSVLSTERKEEAMRDQSQIYLPINNALTKVG